MKESSSRISLIISLLVLISLACNTPILSQLLPDTGSSDDTDGSAIDDGSATSDSSDTPHNTDGAELTFIPGATFQMGSPATDTLADEDEFPQHQVTVDEFYIYTYEVTNQMYSVCVDAGYCMSPQSLEKGPTSHFEDPEFAENPVVSVDWVMARDYCSWAGSRLPTEAEWELASRGPDSLYYPWGEEEPTCDYVNMGGCLVPPDTQPVGYYQKGNSPDEVWDMSGNVWEWVHDWYTDDYYAQSPADNPIGPLEPQDPDKPLRVIRGGGLNSDPSRMRSAARKGLNPYRVFTDVGIRCVAGEELALPAAYDHGRDRHERVPPDSADGGDSADDPDGDLDVGYFEIGVINGPCPDGSGMIELNFSLITSPPPVVVNARQDAAWWDDHCDYDEVLREATCIGSEPLSYMTNPPPTFLLDICAATPEWGDCFINYPINKPTDCDGTERRYEIDTECIEIDGSLTPVITFEFWGSGEDLSFATANGVLLTCLYDFGLEKFHCRGLPGDIGEDLEFVASFTDGTTWTTRVTFPDCLGSVDFIPPWRLSGVDCLPTAAGWEYYAVIDTDLDVTWLPDTWTLTGVEAPKTCVALEPPEPVGRWYCNFAIRDFYTTLEFCAEWDGGTSSHCEIFPESQFGDMLPARCFEPGGGDDDWACSDFTTSADCMAHSAECEWVNAACYDRP